MVNKLTSEEKQFLVENFRLADRVGNAETIALIDLVNEDATTEYIENIKVVLGTDYSFVAASQLMKRIGFLLTVPTLFTMTVYDKGLIINLEKSLIVSSYKDGIWLPKLDLTNVNVEVKKNNRHEYREKIVKNTFNTLAEIISCVSSTSGVPKPILWENVAVYVYWLYETCIPSVINNSALLEEDFKYLVYDASGSFFKESKNPLTTFYRHPTKSRGNRKRRTCCFYYALEQNGTCCKTCPKTIEQLNKLPLK